VAWALLAAATVLCVEIALRLPLVATVTLLIDTARKAAWIVSSARISDHWKERAVPRLAVRMLSASLRLLGCILLVFAPLLVALLAGAAAGLPTSAMVASLTGTLVLFAVATAYVMIRRRLARV